MIRLLHVFTEEPLSSRDVSSELTARGRDFHTRHMSPEPILMVPFDANILNTQWYLYFLSTVDTVCRQYGQIINTRLCLLHLTRDTLVSTDLTKFMLQPTFFCFVKSTNRNAA